jgi:Ca2+-binding RTX toxin-like protein
VQYFDPLESRRLMTFIGFRDADMLSVQGTPGDDQIVISLAPGGARVRVQINQDAPVDLPLTSLRPGHDVKSIFIFGLGGNDTIREEDPALAGLRTVGMNGGPGNDLLVCTADDSEFLGEEGDDTIIASGDDKLSVGGGPGRDSITSTGLANATISGGSGMDTITTGLGNDSIWGGPGSDSISSGGGDDVIFAGRGNDSIDGGDGNDWIFGQQGDDTLHGGNGDDHLYGQSGNDQLNGDGGMNTLFGGGGGNDVLNAAASDVARGREYQRFPRLFGTLLAGYVLDF